MREENKRTTVILRGTESIYNYSQNRKVGLMLRAYLNRDPLLYKKVIISITNALLSLTFRH